MNIGDKGLGSSVAPAPSTIGKDGVIQQGKPSGPGHEGSRETYDGRIISVPRDYCWTPSGSGNVLIGYKIWAFQREATNLANSVTQTSLRSHVKGSIIEHCYGDDAGKLGGFTSGTHIAGGYIGRKVGSAAGSSVGSWIDNKLGLGDQSACGGNCAKSESSEDHKKSDKKPPFRGDPNSTTQGPDNSRTYGDDGYPQTDRDAGHPDESGIGSEDHSHDWSRPDDGGPPTNLDRGPPRAPQPGDPPVPWRGS